MESPENKSFAEKLERLFKEKTKPDGKRYTPTDILEATGSILTRVHLWKLRNGKADNPSLKVIQSLADAFGIPPSYFFNNKDPEGKDLRAILALFHLSIDEQEGILLMFEALKKSKE